MRDASHGVVTDNRFHDNCVGAVILDTGSKGPASHWTLRNNQVFHNDKFCPKSSDTPFPTSGTGIAIFGGVNNLVGHNTIWAIHPANAGVPFAGRTVLDAG